MQNSLTVQTAKAQKVATKQVTLAFLENIHSFCWL